MLIEKILSLFNECEPTVKQVLSRVLYKEWQRLSDQKPRGIIEDIRDIIDSEARLTDEA